MNKMKDAEKLDMIVLMLTDVMKEASDLLFVAAQLQLQALRRHLEARSLTTPSIRRSACQERSR